MSTHKKPRGRPATGIGTSLNVRLQPTQLAQLDAWISTLPDPKPSRPEAIRQALKVILDIAEKDRDSTRS